MQQLGIELGRDRTLQFVSVQGKSSVTVKEFVDSRESLKMFNWGELQDIFILEKSH